MNRLIPILLFCLGLVLLGWWSQADHAERMERHVQEGASEAIEGPWRHGVGVVVSGRDISISGTAHDTLEKAKMLSSLEGVEGYRVIHDNLDLLPVSDIYVLEAMKDETGLVLTGVVADGTQKMRISNSFPKANIDGVTLASGEPNDAWAPAALASLEALDQLEYGTMRMEETVVYVSGHATNMRTKAGVEGRLLTLPAAYRHDSNISAPQEVVRIVPRDPSGLAVIQSGSDTNALSDTDGAVSDQTDGKVVEGRLPTVVALGPWNDAFDTAELETGDAQEAPNVEPLLKDDVATQPQTLENALEVVSVETTETSDVTTDAAPVQDAVPLVTLTSCQNQTDAILSEAGVSFVPSSAELEADASAVVLKLTSAMAVCVQNTDLIAIVSGHTDSQGSEDANFQLSDERARTVVAQLIANGLPQSRLVSRGFGESQPIADNETAEGRAANRRTEIRWINN